MLSASETTRWRLELTLLLASDEVLQRDARKLRAPALTCVQDDRCILLSQLQIINN